MDRYDLRSLSLAVLALAISTQPSRAEGAADQTTQRDLAVSGMEDHRSAPVDYGYGPGVKPPPARKAMLTAGSGSGVVPIGGPSAGTAGVFGTPVTWPIIAIHVILLPDGRVLNYGTDETGAQGAELLYDVWDPSLGTESSAHLVLPNTTPTDIFCSGQSVMWQAGDVLITGGDLTVTDKRNSSRNDTTIFSPQANTLTENVPMAYARWYASLVALPDGEMVVFGGRQNGTKSHPPVTTPEVYNQATGWRTLTGATSNAAFGANTKWYYPRAYVAPGGNVFVLAIDGTMYSVNTTDTGSIFTFSQTTLPGSNLLPTATFAPGQLLSVRNNAAAVIVDITGPAPVVTPTSSMSQVRYWSSGTVLADGQVLVTGGSLVRNKLTGVAYAAEIWNPASGQWTLGASATIPRLYHSNALLLPDGSVLTAGGGAPGPVKNLNAEIYYPPYLYANDGSGNPAVRPALSAVPSSLVVGQQLTVAVGPTDQITRLTLVRTGSASHANNSDQRFIDLTPNLVQTAQQISATLPTDPTALLPGYYMLFAINQAGVPSIASILLITAS